MLPFGGVIPNRGRPPRPHNVPNIPRLQMNPPVRPARNRYVPIPSTREFLITIQNFVGTHNDVSLAILPLVTKFVIGREENDENDGYHFHCYVYTIREHPVINELRERLRLRLFPNMPRHLVSLNIKSLDKPKDVTSAIHYVSKADRYVRLLNVPERKCHLYFRTHSWIRKNPVFDEMHHFVFEFVISKKNRKDDLLSLHQNYWGEVALQAKLLRHQQQGREFLDTHILLPGQWVSDLHEWCTAVLLLPLDRPLENPKEKNLFLHGPPGYGKTRTLESLLPELLTRAYFPTSAGQFLFTGLRRNHKAIYFCDACPEVWELLPIREVLLRVTEGNLVSVELKHRDPVNVEFYGPVIIVSNFDPPMNEGFHRAFHRRFTIIHADRSWNECAQFVDIIPETPPELIVDIENAIDEVLHDNSPPVIQGDPPINEEENNQAGVDENNQPGVQDDIGIHAVAPVENSPQPALENLPIDGSFDWLNLPFE